MGNSFGRLFQISTWGESHGPELGVVIDGCPPKVPIQEQDIQRELDRRRPGQSKITTQRQEQDRVRIVSGVYEDVSLGTPIAMLIPNADQRGRDYSALKSRYRPSHADFTYDQKYGIRAVEGGGRASARETVGRVAAGAVARQVLASAGIDIVGWVKRVQDISTDVNYDTTTQEMVDANIVRCPVPEVADEMQQRIEQIRKQGDSIGGIVEAVARHVPAGWGQPVFDKLDACLAHAMLSLPAAKGFEIGSGFAGTFQTGSEHNDLFYRDASGQIRTKTNHSGGIQGGISNGENIVIRVAFKPTATIMQKQPTVDSAGNPTTLEPRGRHDPCVLPRAVPIVEAMLALVLVDHMLLHRGQCGSEMGQR